MEFFGIGGPELMVLLVLAGLVLGPRRIAKVAREAGQFVDQIRGLARNLTQEFNREINLLEVAERKSSSAPASGSLAAQNEQGAATQTEGELPEAYRRFREDFPSEGKVDSPSDEPARGDGQRKPGTPAVTTPDPPPKK